MNSAVAAELVDADRSPKLANEIETWLAEISALEGYDADRAPVVVSR